ncbi:MAG: hypothetical protein GY950_34835, partial [bacterium]|nr:hypothetical protein [bacterium]
MIKRSPKKEYYPVSLQQEGVYLQSILDPDNSVWNTSHSWRYEGDLDVGAFKDAVEALIKRQATLRTNFRLVKETIFQVVQNTVGIDSFFTFIDLWGDGKTLAQAETAARELEEESARWPYDLSSRPLVRFTLVRLGEKDFVIVIGKHHIISDVTSRQLLLRELTALYNARITGKPSQLEPVDIHYYDYAVWQQEFLASSHYLRQKEYWLSQFPVSDELPLLNFPIDFPRDVERRSRTGIFEMELAPELTARARTFALRRRVSFSASFLFAYYVLLSRYSGQSDIIIGTLYRGRNTDKKNLNKLIGLFANRVGIRLDIADSN